MHVRFKARSVKALQQHLFIHRLVIQAKYAPVGQRALHGTVQARSKTFTGE